MDRQAKNDRLTALALRARDGDRGALADFISLAQGDVWRLCAYLAHSDAADDLAQETFERAIRSLPRFHGMSGARPWLLTICRRVCVDATRRSIRRRNLASAVEASAEVGARASVLGSTVEVDVAIAGLTEERRTAFVLTQIIGLPYAEAAQVLSVPVGTIRSRVSRARSDLVDELGESDDASQEPRSFSRKGRSADG